MRTALEKRCSGSNGDLVEAVREFVAQSRSEDIESIFQSIGVSANRVLDATEVLERVKRSDWHSIMRDPNGALVKGVPFRNERVPFVIERAAPKLGEHTDFILEEFGIEAAHLDNIFG